MTTSKPTTATMTASGPAQIFFSLALAVLIGFIIHVGRGVLIPFVIAAFLCFLIYTLRQQMSRLPVLGRYLPNWFCYLMAFAVIVAAFMFFIAIIRDNIGDVLRKWPAYEDQFSGFAANAITWIKAQDFIPTEFAGGVQELKNTALGMITPILRQALGSVGGITANLLTLGTVLFYTAFMLLERGRIFNKISLLSGNDRQRVAVNETIADIGGLVRQYITVKTLTNLVTAIVSYLIMRAFGLDFPEFWALLIFVFNYIPIFGAALAITMPVLLMVVQTGGGPVRALFMLGAMVGAEQVMSSIIEPRLIGKTLNLSPLVILFSLAVWGSLWGFTGVLLSIPMTITLMLILTQFNATRPIAIMMSESGEIAALKHGSEDAQVDPA
ncbi:MAG: AI-2E family transporter [Pseudomonadota bacterium]